MSEQPKNQALYEWRAALMSLRGPDRMTRLVLITLAMWANEQLIAWPSQREIAKRAGVSERTVRTHLDKADAAGWITRKRQRTAGSKWAHDVYTLCIPELHTQVPYETRQAA